MSITFAYTLQRSNRRSLLITVQDSGDIVVTAPKRMSVDLIEAYLKQKEQWAVKKSQSHKRRLAGWKPHTFREGDEIRVFGTPYRLEIAQAAKRVQIIGSAIVVDADVQDVQDALEIFLKAKAKRYFQKAVDHYATQMGTRVSRVWLSGAKKRWGSCNNQNGLNINWRLVMAPKAVIHSVIVHELAHTIKKDHSPAFWSIVLEHYPNYKRAKAWLREREHLLRW